MSIRRQIKKRLYESPDFYHRLLVARSRLTVPGRAGHIRRYLERPGPHLLQLGSGRNHFEGWLNSDLYAKPPRFVFLDLTKPLPLPDQSFDRIFSEHAIEHIDWRAGQLMLRECHRVLKLGGRIHLETPDLTYYAELLTNDLDELKRKAVEECCREHGNPIGDPSPCFVLNHMARHYGHQFIYDETYLSAMLAKCGFVNIRRMPGRDSEDPHFHQASGRKPSIDMRCNLVMEAEKGEGGAES